MRVSLYFCRVPSFHSQSLSHKSTTFNRKGKFSPILICVSIVIHSLSQLNSIQFHGQSYSQLLVQTEQELKVRQSVQFFMVVSYALFTFMAQLYSNTLKVNFGEKRRLSILHFGMWNELQFILSNISTFCWKQKLCCPYLFTTERGWLFVGRAVWK